MEKISLIIVRDNTNQKKMRVARLMIDTINFRAKKCIKDEEGNYKMLSHQFFKHI